MKKPLLFLLLPTFAFTIVNAQHNEKIEGVHLLKDSVLLKNDYTFNVPNSKFLYETEKGKVFELPLDHMRCLVPTIESNMPVYKVNPLNHAIVPVPIPNALRKNPIIIQTTPQLYPR